MLAVMGKPRIPDYLQGLAGEIRLDESMSKHTSWRVGGVAEVFFTPANKDALVALITRLPAETPLNWVGLGSNLLVRDGGVRGVVVCLHKGLNDIEQVSEDTIYAQAGVTSAKVAKFAHKAGLGGVAFLAGIPGSFGGALAMNAGAFGGETWEQVQRVEILTLAGELVWRDVEAFDVDYRHVEPKQESDAGACFIGAELRLEKTVGEELGKGDIRDLLAKRAETQPIQTYNAGSVFKNPEGNFAARLLESAGLKGQRMGGAAFSEKHANFIVNLGDATAADIEGLIELGRIKVQSQFGIELIPEVRVIGEAVA